jgi:hypothetical protein
MGGRKRGEVPARLLRLEQRFAVWRKRRKPGERIPERLWKAAARLAAEYGVNQTASVLTLDYYSLKKHVDRQIAGTASTAQFVELPSTPLAPLSECVIEFADGTGASMRVHLKGTDVPDLLALGRSFWSAE